MKLTTKRLTWHCWLGLPLLLTLLGCGSSQIPKTDKPESMAQKTSTEVNATAELPKTSSPQISEDDFRMAAYEGRIDVVRRAIEAGINVNAADREKSLTALHMSAYNGHSQVVKLLATHGATIDCRDSEGKTPLIHACTGPFAETVEILLEAGADVNAKEATEGFTPLMMGAGLGQLDVVQVLLRHHADKAILDADGDSAAVHATNSQHQDIVKLLQ